MRPCASRRGLLVLVLLTGTTACRAPAPAVDVPRLTAEGRVAPAPFVRCRTWGLHGPLTSDARVYAWEGGEVELRSVTVGGVLRPRKRLLVDGRDPQGRQTFFLVDTATSGSILSTADPLYAGAIVDPRSRFLNYGERVRSGCLGQLRELRLGSLVGRDVVVGLVEQPNQLATPVNIIGMEHLQGLVLRHRGGRWSLVNRTAADPDPRAIAIPLEAPGLPMVRVRSPSGQSVYALLDTGAPEAHAVSPSPRGNYDLVDGAGRRLLGVPVGRTFEAAGLHAGGRPVAILIGLDTLESIEFDLDLGAGVWRVVPPAPR